MKTNLPPANYRPIGEIENKRLLLEMMQYVHIFCSEHDIRYFLYFGSLLGAVRHHGFIPWDDDMDICMTRAEYEKFIRIFPHDDSSRYKVMTVKDTGHYVPYAKIIDTATWYVEPGYPPIGLNIDLFIIDNEGQTRTGAKLFLHLVSFFLICKYYAISQEIFRTPMRRTLYKVLHAVFGLIGGSAFLRIVDWVSASRRRKRLMRYVGSVNASRYNERQILRGEWFEDTVLLDFEGYRFYAPSGYSSVLETIYVNYMDLPAVEHRVAHHSAEKWIRA